MEEVKGIAKTALSKCEEKKIKDWSTIKSTIKGSLSEFLYERTKRKPMILPVIMEI
jgi:ribonuclease J